MTSNRLFYGDDVPANLLASLESRDVALWVRSLPSDPPSQEALVSFLGLPWRLILMETYEPDLLQALEAAASSSDPMTRRRGYVQVIESDPSRFELPKRSLPVYLLNGRKLGETASDHGSRLNRITMLEELRRSGVRELLVISDSDDPVPPGLGDIWSSGFRSYLTFVSEAEKAEDHLETWLSETDGGPSATLLQLDASRVVEVILERFGATYPEDRIAVRVRDLQGTFATIDVTELDEPERPILDRYELVQERDLTPMMPEELSSEDFEMFFHTPEESWRPYAAGLPWIRDKQCIDDLGELLKILDRAGPEENSIAYISCESGAGGTTLARILAWHFARLGYPTLVAKPVPFAPEALPVVNFLNRVIEQARGQTPHVAAAAGEATQQERREDDKAADSRRYEAPWLLVFDTLHWEGRDGDLVRFRSELEKSGRRACILVVTGTQLGLSFYDTKTFHQVAELNHAIDKETALDLGRHLNEYLRVYGKEREDWQWESFHEDHTVQYLEGQSAFWVSLSFWIRGQYNLDESIQEWIYRTFKENSQDETIRDAILEIAAMSSERIPLPDALLPESAGRWPVAQLLEDAAPTLGALGLVRISEGTNKYWGLIHDILGRFLINALFYDFPMRDELGFAEASDAEHLRFLLLKRISQKAILGERAFRHIGDEFATSIFKLDPGSGRGSFVSLWREVLATLDSMPRPLRDTSRVFRHHTAVSRRRVATLDEVYYGVTNEDKLLLLERAIDDIKYALKFIAYEPGKPGSDSNLNLYNSLANAYFDLAEVEMDRKASDERIVELRLLANEATRSVYEESPTNSFAIETYVRNLLQSARTDPAEAVENCVAALGIVFSALTSNETTYRTSHLGQLADRALAILFRQPAATSPTANPSGPIDVLLGAWTALAKGQEGDERLDLTAVPAANVERALEILADPAGRGQMQVIRMTYDLTCIVRPLAFKEQLEFVEQLDATDYRSTPQLRLEHAILLYQNSRANEGDKAFYRLRQVWRESEHFVHIPDRLRWLRVAETGDLQTVQAITASDYGNRAMARVGQLANSLIPFRPEEHGIRNLIPGMRFACHVSFGHNGAFLRPVTAQGSGRSEIKVG